MRCLTVGTVADPPALHMTEEGKGTVISDQLILDLL